MASFPAPRGSAITFPWLRLRLDIRLHLTSEDHTSDSRPGKLRCRKCRAACSRKAPTRDGDAIAAARCRLPLVEVAPSTPMISKHSPITLLDVLKSRTQSFAPYHVWHIGRPSEQYDGRTFASGYVGDLAYLHACSVTYAVFYRKPIAEIDPCHTF